MSSSSWSSAPSSAGIARSQLRPSPSPPIPPSSSTSSSVDRVPLSQRRVAGGTLPPGRPTVAAQPSKPRGDPSEEIASTVTGRELTHLRTLFDIPSNIRLLPPTPDDRATSSRPGRVALYESSFKAGLRLPPHPFVVALLARYRLTLSQLVPNSVRTVCSFLVLCRILGLEPQVTLFRAFYLLRRQGDWWKFHPRPLRTLRFSLPSNVKGWKTRFFFADVEGLGSTWGEPDDSPNKNNTVVPRDSEAFRRLLLADIPGPRDLLSDGNLRLAYDLPRGGEDRILLFFSLFSIWLLRGPFYLCCVYSTAT